MSGPQPYQPYEAEITISPTYFQHIHASLGKIIDAKIEIPKKYIQLLFFSAIGLGNAKVLEFLIDKGADIMAKNEYGISALELAETVKFGDVIETLQETNDCVGENWRVSYGRYGFVHKEPIFT